MSRRAKVQAAEAIAKLARKPRAAKGVGKRDRLLKAFHDDSLALRLADGEALTNVSMVIKGAPSKLKDWDPMERTVFIAFGPGVVDNVQINGKLVTAYAPFKDLFSVTPAAVMTDYEFLRPLRDGDTVTIGRVETRMIQYASASFTRPWDNHPSGLAPKKQGE